MIKVKLLKRMIARDKDGKQDHRTQGAIAYLDDASFKYHKAMGAVEEVVDEPKPKKSKKPKAKSADTVSSDQPDL